MLEKHALLKKPTINPALYWSIAYVFFWMVGLAIFTASTQVHDTGYHLSQTYKQHQVLAGTQFILTEGLAGIALLIVLNYLYKIPHSKTQLVLSIVLCSISILQSILGIFLLKEAQNKTYNTVHQLFTIINKLDGVKMLLLGLVALIILKNSAIVINNWFKTLSASLNISILLSGLGYLFSNNALRHACLHIPATATYLVGKHKHIKAQRCTTETKQSTIKNVPTINSWYVFLHWFKNINSSRNGFFKRQPRRSMQSPRSF